MRWGLQPSGARQGPNSKAHSPHLGHQQHCHGHQRLRPPASSRQGFRTTCPLWAHHPHYPNVIALAKSWNVRRRPFCEIQEVGIEPPEAVIPSSHRAVTSPSGLSPASRHPRLKQKLKTYTHSRLVCAEARPASGGGVPCVQVDGGFAPHSSADSRKVCVAPTHGVRGRAAVGGCTFPPLQPPPPQQAGQQPQPH